MLEEALGRDEEVQQAAEPITLVAALQQAEHLAQHSRGRGFEGRIEGAEGALHRCIQGLRVLREESRVLSATPGSPQHTSEPSCTPQPPVGKVALQQLRG